MNAEKEKKRLDVVDCGPQAAGEDDLVRIIFEALHSSIGGVVLSETDGTIRWANPAFLRMSGHSSPDLLIGKKLTDLFAAEDVQSMKDLADVIHRGDGDRAEMSMHHDEGGLFFVEVTDQDLKNTEGRVIGRVSSMIDISLRKKVESALKAQQLRLQTLSAKLVDAQEAERSRVSRELHDSIGASLSALKFSVERWFDQQKGPDGVSCSPPDDIVANIQQIIEEVRRISQNLHPSILDDLGLVTAIRSFCRQSRKTYPELEIRSDLSVEEDAVPESHQLMIYRMVQECITNALRHGGADTVHLSLKASGSEGVSLAVRDNGSGFDAAAAKSPDWPSGIGLESMRERAELTGGRLIIESQPGKGTVVRCRWPGERR